MELPDGAVFCCWCGIRQTKDRSEISVPEPELLPSGRYRIYLRKEKISITERTAAECKAKARALRAGYATKDSGRSKLTVGEMVDAFIADHENVFSPSTVKTYKSARKSMFPEAMSKKPEEINWQSEINRAAKSVHPKTLSNNWHIVTAALKANDISIPVSITLPKAPKPDKPWLDYEQITEFLELIRGTECELVALLALHGLRRSEILDLNSDDIDTDKMTIRVSGAVVNGEHGMVHKDTNKSAASQRIVPIMIDRLAEMSAGLTGPVVTVHPNTPYDQINSICDANGLPKVGLHGLRRSFCSLAFHLGCNAQTVMQLGGWSDLTVVNSVYRKLAIQERNDDVEKMRSFYRV